MYINKFLKRLRSFALAVVLLQSFLLPAVTHAVSMSLTINTASSTLPTSVGASQTFNQNVSVTVANSNGNNGWVSAKFTVNNIAASCQDVSSATGNGTYVKALSLTSPSSTGSFPVSVSVYSNTNCTGGATTASLGNLVVDGTAPIIAAHSDVTVEATSASGATVNYTSPSTSDNVDAAGTATCLPASGNTFVLGNTTVTCNATDAAGNMATATTFVVHVVDTTAPVVATVSNVVAEATSASGAAVSYSTPTATDAVTTPLTTICAPASGTTFPLGDTTVTCSASDTAGNTGSSTFIVTVQDTTAPSIDSHSNLTAEATSADGANVDYTAPSTSDLVDGIASAVCTPTSGTLFALGINTVNCSYSDIHGNAATSTSFNITVSDTTPPTIATHDTVTATSTNGINAVVAYTSPSTADAVDGAGEAACLPASGSTFTLGNTTVTCNATDAAGNAATATTFTVSVAYTPIIDPCMFVPTPGCPNYCTFFPFMPTCIATDTDNISATTENSAPNSGDGNADGTQDSAQNTVASFMNPNDSNTTDSYVTLEVLPTTLPIPFGPPLTIPSNWHITYVGPAKPQDFSAPVPTDRTYPVGLFDLNLSNAVLASYVGVYNELCTEEISPEDQNTCTFFGSLIATESTVSVRLLFDRVIDHSNWTIEQYSKALGSYSPYTASVQDEVVGFLRTTITWTLTDGGAGDDDANVNGNITASNATISDPIGPSVKTAATSTTPTTTTTPGTITTPHVKTANTSNNGAADTEATESTPAVLGDNQPAGQTSSISTVADTTPKAPKPDSVKDWWWLLLVLALLVGAYFGYKKYQKDNE